MSKSKFTHHGFPVEVAKKLFHDGFKNHAHSAAIILHDIQFWFSECLNKGDEYHFHNGSYWTYNSRKSLMDKYPYMTESTVKKSIELLRLNGYIISGNYNKLKIDRTLWYTLTNKSLEIYGIDFNHSLEQYTDDNGVLHQPLEYKDNDIGEIHPPLPNATNNATSYSTNNAKADSEKSESYSSPLNEKSGKLDSEKDTSNLDEQWLNENEKKEKTSGKKEKKDELWVRLVDTYFRWYKEFNDDIPPKFSGKGAGPERQQMKYLKEHLIDISKGDEEKAANTFEYISKNWKRLDKFYHDKYEIKFIYSQISKIIAYFKQKQDGQSPPTSMEDFLQYHWERTGKNTSE